MTNATAAEGTEQGLAAFRPSLPDPDSKPRQLGATEVARALLHRVASASGEHSSVELTRNAKGDTQIKVTCRTGESEDIATLEDAAAKAIATYNSLRSLFPMGSPLDA